MYEAYPWQKKMHESKAKIKFVQAGRRAGKTRAALQEALRQIREASINPVQFPGKGEKLTAEQAGLVSVVVGAGAAWFGLYVNSTSTGQSKD